MSPVRARQRSGVERGVALTYVAIVWAVILGYARWGNVPGRATLVGVTLTEQRKRRRRLVGARAANS
jgi:hypothetical protein